MLATEKNYDSFSLILALSLKYIDRNRTLNKEGRGFFISCDGITQITDKVA
jgi:hypothetical protein